MIEVNRGKSIQVLMGQKILDLFFFFLVWIIALSKIFIVPYI